MWWEYLLAIVGPIALGIALGFMRRNPNSDRALYFLLIILVIALGTLMFNMRIPSLVGLISVIVGIAAGMIIQYYPPRR